MQYCSKKGTQRTFLAICMAISNAFIRSWMWRTAAWLDENFVSSFVSWLISASFLFWGEVGGHVLETFKIFYNSAVLLHNSSYLILKEETI